MGGADTYRAARADMADHGGSFDLGIALQVIMWTTIGVGVIMVMVVLLMR